MVGGIADSEIREADDCMNSGQGNIYSPFSAVLWQLGNKVSSQLDDRKCDIRCASVVKVDRLIDAVLTL